MTAWEDRKLTSSHNTPNIRLHKKQFILKNNWGLIEELLYNKRERDLTEEDRRDGETVFVGTSLLQDNLQACQTGRDLWKLSGIECVGEHHFSCSPSKCSSHPARPPQHVPCFFSYHLLQPQPASPQGHPRALHLLLLQPVHITVVARWLTGCPRCNAHPLWLQPGCQNHLATQSTNRLLLYKGTLSKLREIAVSSTS